MAYMDALEYRIFMALRAILDEAYAFKLPPFKLEFEKISKQSKHGDWRMPTRDAKTGALQIARIRVCNMNRDTRFIILTCIHELAHHADYYIDKQIGHQDTFYEHYYKLFKTACTMSIITPEMVRQLNTNGGDGRSDKKLLKMIDERKPNLSPDVNKEYMSGRTLIQVFNAFTASKILKESGFKFNSRSKGWEMIVYSKDIELWCDFVRWKTNTQPIISGVLDTTVIARATLSGDTYPVKDELKTHGYYYRDKKWHKTFLATDTDKERLFVSSLSPKSIVEIEITY